LLAVVNIRSARQEKLAANRADKLKEKN
jgi:hypothetical protein